MMPAQTGATALQTVEAIQDEQVDMRQPGVHQRGHQWRGVLEKEDEQFARELCWLLCSSVRKNEGVPAHYDVL